MDNSPFLGPVASLYRPISSTFLACLSPCGILIQLMERNSFHGLQSLSLMFQVGLSGFLSLVSQVGLSVLSGFCKQSNEWMNVERLDVRPLDSRQSGC